MADDIRPGDVVVCVDAQNSHGLLVEQKIYRVTRIAPSGTRGRITGTSQVITSVEQALIIEGVLGLTGRPIGWVKARFRKLPTADTEFTAQMRALKPRQRSKQEA